MLVPWKKSLVILVGLVAFRSAAFAQPVLGDIIRRADGSPLEMSQLRAIRECKFLGGHLPTIRELVVALNPKGISMEDPGDGVSRLIETEDNDRFYYYYRTYVRPPEAFDSFWSSSAEPNRPHYGLLFGTDGVIYTDGRFMLGTVRCMHEL
jgi:hypothetical protein